MDTDNNQIYKIAKYLDKYTKDGNKKGSMYLQKLNNYLHKVQHGGNGQAMLIVGEIQGMVGQVIKVHQHEGEALTDKLQELRSNYSLDQNVNYESVKLMLEEKIRDAKNASLLSEASAASTAPQTQSFTASEAHVAQQAELTPDKIQNMTLKEFATIAVNRANITSSKEKAIKALILGLKKISFNDLNSDKLVMELQKIDNFQLNPNNVTLVITAVNTLKNEVDINVLKNIFQNPDSKDSSASSAPTRASKSESEISTFNVFFYTNDGEEAQFDTQYFNSNLRDKVDAIIKESLSITDDEFKSYDDNGTTRVGYYDNQKTYTYMLKQGKMLIPFISAVNTTDTTIDVGNTKFRIFILPFIKNAPIKDIETIIKKEIKKLLFLRENLKTQMFYVQGYVVEPETNNLKKKYKFPKNEGQDKILDYSFVERYMSKILDTLKLTDTNVVNTTDYDISNDEIVIFLSKSQKIVEFVDRINKSKTYIELPSSKNDPRLTHVRLFIRPRPPISIKNIEDEDEDVKEYEKAVNNLSSKIFSEIQLLVPQPPQAGPAPAPAKAQASSAQPQTGPAPQPQSPSPENLTTNTFVVVGHIVVDPQTNFLGIRYKFPKKTITTRNGKEQQIDVLQEEYRESVLQALELREEVVTNVSFKIIGKANEMVKIVLQTQKNIRTFVDSVNNNEKAVVMLPISTGLQKKDGSVRLFVKPMSYLINDAEQETIEQKKQTAINKLERIIDEEISNKVRDSQKVQPLSAQSLEATTFDVVGFYIDRNNRVERYYILPVNKDLVLSVLEDINRSKVNKTVMVTDTDEKSEKSKNFVQITFNESLSINKVIESVNTEQPNQVTFEETDDNKRSVYIFIVPIKYSNTSTNTEYRERINYMREQEMIKIREKMEEIAKQQSAQQAQQSASKSRQQSASKSRQQPVSPAQQPAFSAQPLAQSTPFTTGRRASTASRGGSRGPYRHPNEEYNL
jgi:hypothetical protein